MGLPDEVPATTGAGGLGEGARAVCGEGGGRCAWRGAAGKARGERSLRRREERLWVVLGRFEKGPSNQHVGGRKTCVVLVCKRSQTNCVEDGDK